MVLFTESASKHGYSERDFWEIMESEPVRIRSRRGVSNVFELLGRNHAGDYIHAVYRKEAAAWIVFHMMRMSPRERALYRRIRKL